jgi:putative ABC transport system ATP-binding protein
MPPALELASIRKQYQGLRPLRIRHLTVSEREVVALGGLDPAAAEVLTNLLTGATLPDEGSVRVLGEDTAAIADPDAWLASLDRFGIVSDRVTLVDGFTVCQNIAIALTLDLDPLTDEVAAHVAALAAEVGLESHALGLAVGLASPSVRFRARIARAIATSPRILLAEHPTASIPRADVPAVASDFFRLARSRALTALITSADQDFIAASDRQLVLDPATGGFKSRGGRPWFW